MPRLFIKEFEGSVGCDDLISFILKMSLALMGTKKSWFYLFKLITEAQQIQGIPQTPALLLFSGLVQQAHCVSSTSQRWQTY